MPAPPAITRFTDEELSRAASFADHAITATIDALSRPPADTPAVERVALGRIAVGVAAIRPRMTADYCASLRVQLQALRRDTVATAPRTAPARASGKLSLALVDEQEVAAEVEINRVAHEIRSLAEHELRELRAYLSTLSGESHVEQNQIELDATQHARALWTAAQLLGAEPGWPVQFMRHGAKPLALTLRRCWAAASTRLEDAGIQAAAYRTLVLPAGMRTTFGGPVVDSRALHAMAQSVQRIEESLQQRSSDRMPSPASFAASAASNSAPPATPALRTEVDARPAPTAPAPTLTDILGHDTARAEPPQAHGVSTVAQILDLLDDDPRLTDDLKPLVERLRQPILKLAAVDPLILTDDEHAAWRFIDRIAWQSSTLPPAPDRERVRTAQVIAGLVDQACKSPSPGAETFQWALERLIVLERNRHERRAARYARQAQSLAAVEQQLLAPGSSSGSDHTQLPTVPADLYDTLPAALTEVPPADAWLESLAMGSIARLLMRGRWVHAELLWRSPQRELWLWGDCRSDEVWPVRRGALRMLFQGRLATTAMPDTVVREAAHRLAERASRTTILATALA
jgi:hypothetical protein